jgi:hypothetical protein
MDSTFTRGQEIRDRKRAGVTGGHRPGVRVPRRQAVDRNGTDGRPTAGARFSS